MRRACRLFWPFLVMVALGAMVPACGTKPRAARARSGSNSPVPGFERLVGEPAPDFSLRDQFGRRQRLSDYRGEVVLLTFVSSHCKSFCPLTAELLARTQDLLGKRAAGVIVLAVNTNYRFSAVDDVIRWSKEHAMTHRWLFVTAQAATLWSVYNDYHVTPGQEHTVLVFLIDATGRIAGLVPIAGQSGIDDEAVVLARSVRSLESKAA